MPSPTPAGNAEHVVIIGAGLGGLSAALQLLGAGRSVTVLEARDKPGGAAGVIEIAGYRFDTGPTVLTMPELIAEALACVGEELADWLDLLPLDPAYRASFHDGSSIELRTDVAAMADQIAGLCGPAEADGYRRMVEFLGGLYAIERNTFIERNLDSPLQLVGPQLARLIALGGFRRLGPKIASYLSDERLHRLFTFQSLYAGVAPHQALALYGVIAYLDSVAGVWFPRGGMHAVPEALAGAAAKHGAQLHYDTRASSIEFAGDRAVAVRTSDGRRFAADAVIVNADAPTAIQDLLPEHLRPRRALRQRLSPSCVVLHIGSGATKTHDSAAHHTISFGQAWRSTFEEVISHGQLMSDPSVLLTNPTRSDPSLAPPDKQAYYALFPAPNLRQAPLDWSVIGPRYRDEMLAVLDQRGLGIDDDSIDAESLVTPADWAAQGYTGGTPFAAAHTFWQTGPFRASTRPTASPNLLFCGGHIQPGVGIPMVLLSGKLAAARLLA